MWQLTDALVAARIVEPLAIKHGLHVALGGSVLHKGESKKDVDLFFYVHSTTQPHSRENLMQELSSIGFSDFKFLDHSKYGDGKAVFSSSFFGKRVDCFFL